MQARCERKRSRNIILRDLVLRSIRAKKHLKHSASASAVFFRYCDYRSTHAHDWFVASTYTNSQTITKEPHLIREEIQNLKEMMW